MVIVPSLHREQLFLVCFLLRVVSDGLKHLAWLWKMWQLCLDDRCWDRLSKVSKRTAARAWLTAWCGVYLNLLNNWIVKGRCVEFEIWYGAFALHRHNSRCIQIYNLYSGFFWNEGQKVVTWETVRNIIIRMNPGLNRGNPKNRDREILHSRKYLSDNFVADSATRMAALLRRWTQEPKTLKMAPKCLPEWLCVQVTAPPGDGSNAENKQLLSHFKGWLLWRMLSFLPMWRFSTE